MCTCTSCENTDGFAQAGFAEWPRGAPAGPRRSAADYAGHVRYAQQWGRGYDGTMHERKECTASMAYYAGSRAAPERLNIPAARWEREGYGYHAKRVWIEAPSNMAEYIAQFEQLNCLKHVPVSIPVDNPTPTLIALARQLRAQRRAERQAFRKAA